jgi:hypothetical protein
VRAREGQALDLIAHGAVQAVTVRRHLKWLKENDEGEKIERVAPMLAV